jgi:hypothetical protein
VCMYNNLHHFLIFDGESFLSLDFKCERVCHDIMERSGSNSSNKAVNVPWSFRSKFITFLRTRTHKHTVCANE